MDAKTEKERLESDSAKIVETKKCKNKKTVSNNHIVKKRTPFRYPKRKNDVYVNTKTNFKVFLKRCEKILDSDAKEVIIHGLGAAINQACNLALQLQELHQDTLELDIKTSTVNLSDDLEPKTDDADYEVNERRNSAIHIRVFRKALIGTLRFQS